MALDGKEHDLQVGYIAQTPVWRPSYRLVIDKEGANLQTWGIVQNLSGEDWTNVSLSLVAEAPLAFDASLATPVIPPRPTVTDGGDVIAVVPRVGDQPGAGPRPPPPPRRAARRRRDGRHGGGSERSRAARSAAGRGPDVPEAQGAEHDGGSRRSTICCEARAAAAAARLGATVRARPSPTTRAHEEPGGAGGDRRAGGDDPLRSAAAGHHPRQERDHGDADRPARPRRGRRAVRARRRRPRLGVAPVPRRALLNKTGGLLERGPLAIFSEGAFVGQGMTDPLPDGATATVPFALDRSVAVEATRERREEGARLYHIEAGQLHHRARDGDADQVQGEERRRPGGEAGDQASARLPGRA